MPSEWFVVRDGKELGPFTPSQLKEQAAQGSLGPDDLVRRGDVPTAAKAGSVKGLFPGAAHQGIPVAKPIAQPVSPQTASARVFREVSGRAAPVVKTWKGLSVTAKIGAAAGGGVLALTFLCCGGFTLLAMVSGSGESKRGVSASVPAFRVQSHILYDEYRQNEVAADERYREKVLEVEGMIESIEKNFTDSIYVTLFVVRFEIGKVQCFFADRHTAEVARLSKGQYVTIRGRCKGKTLNVLLRNCELVPTKGQ